MRAEIERLIADLDAARSDGTIYTYGHIQERLRAIAAVVPTAKAEFEVAVSAERQRQIEKGYTAEHDDKHGARHLINWAAENVVNGKPVRALALLGATLQHLDRAAIVSEPSTPEQEGNRG